MAKRQLMEFLQNYHQSDMTRMHMPGHKGRMGLKANFDLSTYDITEIQGADSLFECDGILREVERLAEQIYHTKRTLISTGGSTLCIQTMLAMVRHRGEKILIARNSHKAAINAMALLGLEPIWVYPESLDQTVFPGVITPQAVEQQLSSHPDVAAVYVTSPDYFGIVSDIRGIKQVCSRYDVPLLVDNAHGAHFCVSGTEHPIACGADLCCDSAHKTLPVLTGGAFLQIGNPEFVAGAKETMSLFGSTSPSYLIMLSIEQALCELSMHGAGPFELLKTRVAEIEQIFLQKGFLTPNHYLRDDTRIVVDTLSGGYTGEEFAELLRQYQIEPEYASQGAVVLLSTPYNTEKDFDRLKRFANEISQRDPIRAAVPELVSPNVVMSVRDAVLSPFEMVATEDAQGRVCADARISCPPGVPIVVPGEQIDKKIMNILNFYSIKDIKVVK